ncbi:terminase small subunit [Arsenophonus nasoniae]|uniref:terminase small subunit n=1 Tax=Arsenophonus nasoniae TaxID=638 RepID=UPI003879AEEE
MGNTPKQEAFCQAFIETGNASEAYRRAYNTEKMKAATINRSAKEMLDNPKVAARIAELQGEHREKHNITVDSLLKEFEEHRQLALKTEQPAAANGATLGKAKLLGFDKVVVDNISSDGSQAQKVPVTIQLIPVSTKKNG